MIGGRPATPLLAALSRFIAFAATSPVIYTRTDSSTPHTFTHHIKMAAIASSSITAKRAAFTGRVSLRAKSSAPVAMKPRGMTVMAFKVTLETPEGAQEIECADDTYVLDAAEVRAVEYFIWDDDIPGFGLRILPSGRKGYVTQYCAGRRPRRMSLGPSTVGDQIIEGGHAARRPAVVAPRRSNIRANRKFSAESAASCRRREEAWRRPK